MALDYAVADVISPRAVEPIHRQVAWQFCYKTCHSSGAIDDCEPCLLLNIYTTHFIWIDTFYLDVVPSRYGRHAVIVIEAKLHFPAIKFPIGVLSSRDIVVGQTCRR